MNEKPILAGFLYKDETSSFGLIGWIISDTKSTREERDISFDELFKHIEFVAKDIGVKVLMAVCQGENLGKRFVKSGYIEAVKNMTHFIKGEIL